MAPAISVSQLSKQYRLGDRLKATSLRELTGSLARRALSGHWRSSTNGSHANGSMWALKDVSFDVAKGEVVGIIGRNGAGKSTLLKILSRITEPTSGRAEIRGRVAALLEVGTGFHPDLTGRENVFLNGAILGMRKDEIRQKFDEIVAFAEIDQFIDTPVKRYSSGMYVRLAFAVAAHLQPEILLVDEVLAVGDIGFQQKCLGKLNEVSTAGRTVLFVSHNMGAVRSLCSRCLLVDRGRLTAQGGPAEVIDAYVASATEDRDRSSVVIPRRAGVRIQVTGLWFENGDGVRISRVALGSDARLLIEYVIDDDSRDVTMCVLIGTRETPLLYSYDTDTDESLRFRRRAGRYKACVPIPLSIFKEGTYVVAAKIGYAREELTDPAARVSIEVRNEQHDFTHHSYRRDRPGYLIKPINWHTTWIEAPR